MSANDFVAKVGRSQLWSKMCLKKQFHWKRLIGYDIDVGLLLCIASLIDWLLVDIEMMILLIKTQLTFWTRVFDLFCVFLPAGVVINAVSTGPDNKKGYFGRGWTSPCLSIFIDQKVLTRGKFKRVQEEKGEEYLTGFPWQCLFLQVVSHTALPSTMPHSRASWTSQATIIRSSWRPQAKEVSVKLNEVFKKLLLLNTASLPFFGHLEAGLVTLTAFSIFGK